jgi:hypothetical protein
MSSAAVRHQGGASFNLAVWVKGVIVKSIAMAIATVGLGAVLYYTWNWGLAPNVKNLNTMSDFWSGPLIVLGFYAVGLSLLAAWNSRTVELTFDAVAGFVAEVGVVLLVAWVIHAFLA